MGHSAGRQQLAAAGPRVSSPVSAEHTCRIWFAEDSSWSVTFLRSLSSSAAMRDSCRNCKVSLPATDVVCSLSMHAVQTQLQEALRLCRLPCHLSAVPSLRETVAASSWQPGVSKAPAGTAGFLTHAHLSLLDLQLGLHVLVRHRLRHWLLQRTCCAPPRGPVGWRPGCGGDHVEGGHLGCWLAPWG